MNNIRQAFLSLLRCNMHLSHISEGISFIPGRYASTLQGNSK